MCNFRGCDDLKVRGSYMQFLKLLRWFKVLSIVKLWSVIVNEGV